MIRLGSLAGYPFEGPRVLGGWTPPARPAVYAIVYKPDPETKPETYAVIYVGHSDDLSTERFPFSHPRAAVLDPAGRQPVEGLHLHATRCPAGCARTASRSPRSSAAIYHPSCNEQQYDRSWKDEWIGEYRAPTTGPLTTGRDPGDHRRVTGPPVDLEWARLLGAVRGERG